MLLQVLSDDEKRSIYDRYGEAGLKGAGAGMGVSLFAKIGTFKLWEMNKERSHESRLFSIRTC